MSTNIIKQKIKWLIKDEDNLIPLSDQSICDEHNKRSMAISRRTVTKYREVLGIRPSSKRKTFNKIY